MKIKYLILCILLMSFIISPIAVFAADTYDMIITDLTEEEIEEIRSGIQLFASTSQTQIARWSKIIDNTKADVNEHSVVYYCPIYEGVAYKNYNIFKFGDQFVTVYYPDSTQWNNGDYRYLKNGSCIEIRTNNIDQTKNILFNDETNRTEINAKLHITENANHGILGGAYNITYQFNSSTHSDAYYIWYNSTYNTNPPYLNDDGTCAVHNYTTIAVPATCTSPGGYKHFCTICNYSYLEPTTEALPHDYDGDVCKTCGYIKENAGTGNNNNNSNTDYGDLNFLGKVNAVVQSKLNDNSMYNSLLYIVNTLSSLFTEDYTSAEGFYALGITNLNVNKPYIEYGPNFGNDVIGDFEQPYKQQTSKIDWGLNNVQVINLDWYFGRIVGYAADGTTPYMTKGVKKTSDAIISGFLWLVFGYNVYINMPNLISGEGGQIVSATSSANGYFNKRKEKENKPKGDKKK